MSEPTINESTRVLKQELKRIDPSVLVHHGRGTAYGWIEIRSNLSREKVMEVVNSLRSQGRIRINQYPDDMSDEMYDCLTVKPHY